MMSELQSRFERCWKDCWNATSFVLNSKKWFLGLFDAKAVKRIVHEEVWTKRFGSVHIIHEAQAALDEIEKQQNVVGMKLRRYIRDFQPKRGINVLAFKACGIGAIVLLLAMAVLSAAFRGPNRWIAPTITGIGALGCITACVLMFLRSRNTLKALKAEFDRALKEMLNLMH